MKIRMVEKAALVAALFGILGIAAGQVHSFDLFWQLHSGRYVLETGKFLYKDTFSLASEAPRFEHCWLHDIVCFLFYKIGGYSGISLLKGLLLAGTAGALALAAHVRGSSCLSFLLMLPVFFFTRSGWLERPQLWTFFLFAVFLWLLERHRAADDRMIFWLVPLMALWVNLHAGAVLAAALIAAYLAGEGGGLLLRRSSANWGGYRKIGALAALLLLASFLTPYPSQLLDTLIHVPQLGFRVDAAGKATGPVTAILNMDWRPTTFAGDPVFYYGAALAAVLLVTGWRKLSLTDLFLLGGLILMGLKLSRHTTFLLLAIVALLPRYVDASIAPVARRLKGAGVPVARWVCLLFASALFVWAAKPAHEVYGFFQTGLRSWHYPVEAAEFVRTHRLPGNLYNTYDWGGYLMWTLFPEYKVFWDGRQNSTEMFQEGWKVMAGHPGWESVLQRHNVKTIVSKGCLVSTGERYPLLDHLAKNEEWSLVFSDESSMVFVRNDAVVKKWLEAYSLPKSRIEETILSEASLLVDVEPGRYKGWWEIARIRISRGEYAEALPALRQYLGRSPERDLQAEIYYRVIHPLVARGS